MVKYKTRAAIAMIELIFAIVIMGIILLSAPELVSTATKSGYVAIQQEGISEVASRVNIILGYSWDENNTDELYLPTVLNVSNGDTGLDQNITTRKRLGTPTRSYRTFSRSDGNQFNASSVLGAEGGDSDDMDDFNAITGLVDLNSSTIDYIETTTVRITSTVSYGDDNLSVGTYLTPNGSNTIKYSPGNYTLAAPSTNIKYISVSLTSTSGENELDKNITLHAFTSNIGATDIEERVF